MTVDESPGADTPSPLKHQEPGLGVAFGCLGILIALTPWLYMLYCVVTSVWSLATAKKIPDGIRPMGLSMLTVAGPLAGVFVFRPLALICSWIADRLGAREAAIAASDVTWPAIGLVVVTGFVGMFLIVLVCNFRGVRMGD